MNFDAYAGTIRDARLEDVAHVLEWSMKGIVNRGPRMRRYGETLAVDVGGRTAVWVGRDQASDAIYFEGKGETTPSLVRSLRKHFVGHTVSRGDVCEDYDAEGAHASLIGFVRRHKGPKVKGGYVALPDNPEDGSTWGAGARGGVSYVRVYEAGKHPDRLHLARPNWARLELESRPHYAKDKLAAASMSPTEFFGFSAWTHRLGEALCQIEIPRYEQPAREWNFDKTTTYLARTFKRHWEEMLSDFGDWQCIGRELEAVWKADEEAAAALARRSSQVTK